MLGRIAEECQLKDIAYDYYRRVRGAPGDTATSTSAYALARHHMTKLGRSAIEKPE